MKRLRANEWALLLLPCAAVAGFAWWQMHKKPPSPADYAPTIEKIEVLPATPLQAFNGYDTQVVVKLKRSELVMPMLDATPDHPGVIVMEPPRFVNEHGLTIAVDIAQANTPYDGNRCQRGFAMKLARVPANAGTVTFNDAVWQRHFYKRSGRGTSAESVTVPVSIVVRREGQTISLPANVNKYRPFALTDAKLSMPLNPDFWAKSDTELSFMLREANGTAVLPLEAAKIMSPRLETEHGGVYSEYDKRDREFIYSFGQGTAGSNGDLRRTFQFPLKQIPKSAGRVTFKALISVNDCWPLPVSILVRKRDGSFPVTK